MSEVTMHESVVAPEYSFLFLDFYLFIFFLTSVKE